MTPGPNPILICPKQHGDTLIFFSLDYIGL
jgi:hypothetical protein